jgi:hypothetical protein
VVEVVDKADMKTVVVAVVVLYTWLINYFYQEIPIR